MKTPEEKFNNDPDYRRLVDTLESLIAKAQFTPSEIREAAIFACIRYETRRQLSHIETRFSDHQTDTDF